jgi:hypothetical protein
MTLHNLQVHRFCIHLHVHPKNFKQIHPLDQKLFKVYEVVQMGVLSIGGSLHAVIYPSVMLGICASVTEGYVHPVSIIKTIIAG